MKKLPKSKLESMRRGKVDGFGSRWSEPTHAINACFTASRDTSVDDVMRRLPNKVLDTFDDPEARIKNHFGYLRDYGFIVGDYDGARLTALGVEAANPVLEVRAKLIESLVKLDEMVGMAHG